MKTKLFLLLAICLTAFSVNAQNPNVVSITGEAQGGWGDGFDQNMTSTNGVNWTLASFTCANAATGGGIKFRANNAWVIDWGNAAFPSGIGTQGGANIVCTAGNWSVTFNSTTGAYVFTPGVPQPVIKLFGTAVTPNSGVAMSFTSGSSYAVTTNLVAGNAQFNIDTVVAGGTGFPNGNASDAALFIPVAAAGQYLVTINYDTADYTFVFIPAIPTIAIVGPGAGGWPPSPQPVGYQDPKKMDTSDGIAYKLKNVALTADLVKFRQGNAWTNSWGNAAFPAGTATVNDGANIMVTAAGNYLAKFNRTTGAYAFNIPSIALVGPATGVNWPAAGDVDARVLTTTDGITYKLNSITLVAGEAKFRYDRQWDDTTGGTFPIAIVGSNDNLIISAAAAGTYSITLNRVTGAFTFGTPILANENFTANTFKVSPNPSSTNWEIVSGNSEITSVQIVNILGKVVYNNNVASNKIVVDASDLSNGLYFAKVSSATATETIKLIKN